MIRPLSDQMELLSSVEGSSEPRRGRPRLSLLLDNRQWLNFLLEEWWVPEASAIRLGVEAVLDEPADQPGRLCVAVWIDPARLPAQDMAVFRAGRWVPTSLAMLQWQDQEVAWPAPIPLSAVVSFSMPTAQEKARMVAMAGSFRNIELPDLPIGLDWARRVPSAEMPPSLPVCRPPDRWDAMRGAAAMALWAVPAIDPWLDVLGESLSLQGAARSASSVGAAWLSHPLWSTIEIEAPRDALWSASRDILSQVELADEWRPLETLDAIVLLAQDRGASKKRLQALHHQACQVLSVQAMVDVGYATHDPLGLALQLVLLRPRADEYAKWAKELIDMPPATWWSGAMLSGLVTRMRGLDKLYRGTRASREFLSIRTWSLTASGQAEAGWRDTRGPTVTWQLSGDRVQFMERNRAWAERKTSARGEWFRADLEDDETRTQAVALARRLHPVSLRRGIRLADTRVEVLGPGRVKADRAGRILQVNGSITLALGSGSEAEVVDELDVDAFRDWMALGSVSELLPPVPRRSAGRTERFDSPVPEPVLAETGALPLQHDEGPTDAPAGLITVQDFISAEEEQDLLAAVDGSPWLPGLSRRVQHYGWKYDYRGRKVEASSYLGPLPAWASALAQRLLDQGLLSQLPDQVIVNEYLAHQGIGKHVDCIDCFVGPIVTISLNESWGMLFRESKGSGRYEKILPRRSAVILSGASRDAWTHEIPKRKKDGKIFRQRRVSLTFRKVNSPSSRSSKMK